MNRVHGVTIREDQAIPVGMAAGEGESNFPAFSAIQMDQQCTRIKLAMLDMPQQRAMLLIEEFMRAAMTPRRAAFALQQMAREIEE